MAWGFVKEIASAATSGSAVTSLAITVPAAGVAQGNIIIVHGGGKGAITAVSDTQGNTYAVEVSESAIGTKSAVAYGVATTALVSGNTITVTFDSSDAEAVLATEWTGGATSTPLDKSATASGTGTAPAAGPTATLTNSDDLYFLCLVHAGGTGLTLTHTTGGLTDLTKVSSTVTLRHARGAHKTLASTTAIDYAGTLSTSTGWSISLAAFKAAPSGQTINLAGTVTPAGALARLIGKAVAGTVTPAGALARLAAKVFGGTITPAGALAAVKPASGTFGIATGSDDGRTEKTGTAYPPVDSDFTNDTATTFSAEKWISGTYTNKVGLMRWDTSALDDASTVLQAKLRIYITAIDDADGRNLVGEWYDFGAAIGTEDYAESVGTTAFSVDITSLTAGAYNEITLTGLANISLTGLTGLRVGVSGGAPSGLNRVIFASYENTSFTEPQLLVGVTGQAVSLAGLITPAGAVARLAAKSLAGSVGPAGALARLVAKALAGTITPAGTLTTLRSQLLAIAGTITPAGGLSRLVAKALAGTVTPGGLLSKLTGKPVGGTVTPAGSLTLAQIKAVLLAGLLTPAGALSKLTGRSLSGSVTPAGVLSKIVGKTLSGTITPSGLLTLLTGVKTLLVGGVITPVGTLTKKASKGLAGVVGLVGTIAFRAAGFNFGAFHDLRARTMFRREIRRSGRGHR